MYKLDHQLKENLSQARARMKHYADKKMIERSFDEGDWVFLKLHPYVQHSVEFRCNGKPCDRYFGLYQIAKKIGTIAYQLALPE